LTHRHGQCTVSKTLLPNTTQIAHSGCGCGAQLNRHCVAQLTGTVLFNLQADRQTGRLVDSNNRLVDSNNRLVDSNNTHNHSHAKKSVFMSVHRLTANRGWVSVSTSSCVRCRAF